TATAQVPREYQLAITLDCDECPSIPERSLILALFGLGFFLHPDVAPQLITLYFFDRQPADTFCHQSLAFFACQAQQIQDGSPMNSSHSRSAANRAALDQMLQNIDGLFFGQDHFAEWPLVRLSECLFAVQAAI